jgi:hypothetical protein
LRKRRQLQSIRYIPSVITANDSIDYMLRKPIGKGSFGIVWKARVINGPHRDEEVAIKIINLDDFKDKSIEEIRVDFELTCSVRSR